MGGGRGCPSLFPNANLSICVILKTPLQADKGQFEGTQVLIFSTDTAPSSVTCLTNIS